MSPTTLSSREFNQDSGKAKTAAERGPVIITDRGRPAHVLLTYKAYKKLLPQRVKIAELLAMPANVELKLGKSREPAQAADLS
jgi:prevent-host-death family protein